MANTSDVGSSMTVALPDFIGFLRVARSEFTGTFGRCSLNATTPPSLSVVIRPTQGRWRAVAKFEVVLNKNSPSATVVLGQHTFLFWTKL